MFHIDPVALNIFGVKVYWYGLLIVTGLILGILVASVREKRKGLPGGTVLDFALIAMPVAIVCARLYYVAFEWDMYRGNLLSVFAVRDGGLAIYGGVIGGVIVGILFTRKRKIRFSALADLCAPALALGQAIGRWGNFVNQEAYGVTVTSPGWQFFPAAVYIERDGLWHAATFFYESAWCLTLCALLLILERKRFFRRDGDVFCAYVFLYGIERMAVEQLRTDSLWWGPLRVSQILSFALIAGVLALTLGHGRLSGARIGAFAGALAVLGLMLAVTLTGHAALQLPCAAALIALGTGLYRTADPPAA